MLTIGRTEVPRYLAMNELVRTLISSPSIDYSLLMPVILFLHSITSPRELIQILVKEYHTITLEHQKTNCLVIFKCWLRESSAHFDFISSDCRELLHDFLADTLMQEQQNAQLSASIKKVQSQLETITDEQLDLTTCLDIYAAELKPLFTKMDSIHSSSTKNSSSCESLDELVRETLRGHVTYPSPNKHPVASSNEEVGSDVINQFPDLDRFGRPKRSTPCSENIPSEDLSSKKTRSTDKNVLLSIRKQKSLIQNYKSPSELAANFTLLELHCGLLTIRPREFTSLSWMHAALKVKHPDMGGCSHLNRYIQYTNQRILWIAREILIYGMEKDSYKKSLFFFIQVAEAALKMNNFNTLFQILEALKLPAIKRLNGWEFLSASKIEKYEALSSFCDASGNYCNYRQHLRNLGSQARIPCLQILLRDISLMEQRYPWKVSSISGLEPGVSDNSIDMSKLDAMFKLLCREVFSLRSPHITSYYTSQVLCPLQIHQTSSVSGQRDRRGRSSRIDSRTDSDLFEDSFFLNDEQLSISTDSSFQQLFTPKSPEIIEQDESNDHEEDNVIYVMIYMSLNSGAMEEDFFNNMSLDSTDENFQSPSLIPLPVSNFFNLTSYLPIPLFSLKMKKQLQSHEKHLENKIQQQMTKDIMDKLELSYHHIIKKDDFVSSRFSIEKMSPQRKKHLASMSNKETFAAIPHDMSILSQDCVQSYAQCIDESLFIVSNNLGTIMEFDSAHLDEVVQEEINRGKKSSSFSLFNSHCGEEAPPLIEGNSAANIGLTAHDDKLLELFTHTASTSISLVELWNWSNSVNGNEKSRLLGGLFKAGLA